MLSLLKRMNKPDKEVNSEIMKYEVGRRVPPNQEAILLARKALEENEREIQKLRRAAY